MKIIFFTHPNFMSSQSMPRFAGMLYDEMKQKGHSVKIWSPTANCYKLSSSPFIKKWLGYIDQYITFPQEVRKRLRNIPPDTLFVFTDNAQGPWVPLVANRPHVVHCHDFLAQQSALNQIQENPTSWTGRRYQAYIRRGYRKGRNFISVSNKTRHDLHQLLGFQPPFSGVIYNGLNQSFDHIEVNKARAFLGGKIGLDLTSGYLLHVGGNQWYKNRSGILAMYDAWRTAYDQKLPLLMVGQEPNVTLRKRWDLSDFRQDIHFLTGLDNQAVQHAYAGATVFLFPSLAEGFGWPIAEAMAAGCPVITTDEVPMTEVAGEAAFLIPKMPSSPEAALAWATNAATVVDTVVTLPASERVSILEAGRKNVMRFDTETYLNNIERMYEQVLTQYVPTMLERI